jgi:hypothetical protein
MSDESHSIYLTVDEWAKIVIERWERKISQLGIYHTGKLLNSFTHFINTQANGDPEKITFAFQFYGKFVDMGVGKGKKHNVEVTNRRAKPWYSKVFWSQFMVLKEILAEKYSMTGQILIITEIDKAKI